MKITIIGTGYVGLVAGACFADSGNQVICVDKDSSKINRLNDKKVPFFEPGLEEMVARNLVSERLTFTTDVVKAVTSSDLIFVAVGTPQGADGKSDLTALHETFAVIEKNAQKQSIVVIKSTVPVGTAATVKAHWAHSRADLSVVSNPEFLKEGSALNDFLKPERVVLGVHSEHSKKVMSDLYSPYVRSGNPVLFMDNTSAELAKYACNAFLAMKVTFINNIALAAEATGADVDEVRRVLISDSRIGSQFLYPGSGYGGSCFPKDVEALIATGKEKHFPTELFSAVQHINDGQKALLFKKIFQHYQKNLSGKKIAVWGVSFKPQTDDIRDAPSLVLIHNLLEAGAVVQAYDPEAMENGKAIWGNRVQWCDKSEQALKGADALVVQTEWNEFRQPDFSLLATVLKDKVVFDGRNLFRQESLQEYGLKYVSIGRPSL